MARSFVLPGIFGPTTAMEAEIALKYILARNIPSLMNGYWEWDNVPKAVSKLYEIALKYECDVSSVYLKVINGESQQK